LLQLVPTAAPQITFTTNLNGMNTATGFQWNNVSVPGYPNIGVSYDYVITAPDGTIKTGTAAASNVNGNASIAPLPDASVAGLFKVVVTPRTAYGTGPVGQASANNQQFKVTKIDSSWSLVQGASASDGPYKLNLTAYLECPGNMPPNLQMWLEKPDGTKIACADTPSQGMCSDTIAAPTQYSCWSKRTFHAASKLPAGASACDYLIFDAARGLAPGAKIMVCANWGGGNVPDFARSTFKFPITLPGVAPSAPLNTRLAFGQ
jgi:hypothetical protein